VLKTFVIKYPASVTVIPLALGILVSYYSGLDLSSLPYMFFLGALIVFAAIAIYVYKTISKGELFLFTYIAVLIIFGIFSFQFQYNKIEENNISRLAPEFKDKKSVIIGVIDEQPEVKDDRVRMLIDVSLIDGKETEGYVLATVYKNMYKDGISGAYRYGDEITIEGKLESVPHRRNPGEFDYGEYLKLHDISAVFIASGFDKIELIGHHEANFFKAKIIIPVKEYSIIVIDEMIGGDEGEYLKGLVLGERSNISKEMKENFVNAGVAHIIAVSGLNVAYVIIIVWGILILIPVRHSYKIIITILFLLFYMYLTGNTPSIVRATIMSSVFLLAQVIERKPNSYNIISFAALVILLIDPRQLFDAGFILSFSALLSIIVIYPRLEKLVNTVSWYRNMDTDKIFGKVTRGIVVLFLGTLAAQIGTLPITAVMFKKISIVSLVTNLFAIPLSNIALALGFVMIIFSTFSVWLASVFASLNSFVMFTQLVLIELCAKVDYAYVETYFVDRMMFIFYYTILALCLTVKIQTYKVRLVMIVLLTGNFFVWKSVADKTDKAEITYIDVGNSNSTLIKMPEGTSILINAGNSINKYTSAQRNVIPYLKSQGINELDLLIVNSLNVNEFRNLVYMVENFPVRKIILPVYYKPVFETKEIAPSFSNTAVEFIDSSRIINKQGKFRIYLYCGNNNESMLTQFTYGWQDFLFSDSYNIEDDFSNTSLIPGDSEIKILKTSGAGSFDYTSAEFLAKANPEIVVISQLKAPRKKLNSDVFKLTLENFGIDVMNTSENGALIFRTNGEVMERVEW
jgi:competence protein ComEC